jgi:hypothetical protein
MVSICQFCTRPRSTRQCLDNLLPRPNPTSLGCHQVIERGNEQNSITPMAHAKTRVAPITAMPAPGDAVAPADEGQTGLGSASFGFYQRATDNGFTVLRVVGEVSTSLL